MPDSEHFFKSLQDRGICLPPLRHSQAKQKAAELISDLKYAQKSSRYLFRGLSNYNYDLKPSIARERHDGRAFDTMDEKIVFTTIRTEGMMFIERGDLSDIDLV